MKINVNNKSLTKCLDTVVKALPQKSILPIFNNILFSIKDGSCSIYAQNGKLQIKGVIAIDTKEEVDMCIPGNIFMNTVRLLNEEELTFDYNEDKFLLQIIAGKKKYKITGENPKEYTIQDVKGKDTVDFKFPAAEFVKYIGTVSKIVNWNDMRPEISGVTMLMNKGSIDISGTHDAMYFYRADTGIKPDKEFGIVMHKDISIAVGMMKGTGDVDVIIGKKSMVIKIDGFELASVLVDVKTPIVLEKYFVYDKEVFVMVNKQDLIMAVKRASNYCGIMSSVIVDIKGDEVKITAENSDYGVDAEEVINVENKDTKDIKFGINLRFLGSILSNINDEFVKIYVTAQNKPIYIKGCDNTDNNEYWGCMLIYFEEKKV